MSSDFRLSGRSGVCLKPSHYETIVNKWPDVGWFEVHTENYMGEGGLPHYYLEKIAARYPLSLHGVGLSLGSADPLDPDHLTHIKILIDRYAPALVSEHLSWGKIGGVHLHDLLPLPYTEEALHIVCAHIEQTQDFLGRQILIENPSTYCQFDQNEMTEEEFLVEMTARSGCALLLDVNNIYVSAYNHGWSAESYLKKIPAHLVREIHLAGHAFKEQQQVRIDDHGSKVCPEVWKLYEKALQQFGPVPSLIEWDTDVPDFPILKEEADKARHILDQYA